MKLTVNELCDQPAQRSVDYHEQDQRIEIGAWDGALLLPDPAPHPSS